MKVPQTLEECFEFFRKEMPLTDIQALLAIEDQNQLFQFHHGLGQWIRNTWGLWTGPYEKNPLKASLKHLEHPDEMSMEIIKYCWKRFKEEDAKLDKEEVRISNKGW